jgi:hypothetical protein
LIVEPLPVIPLDYAAEANPRRPAGLLLRILLALSWCIAAGATVLVWFHTESVLGTGPVLMSFALVVILLSAMPSSRHVPSLLLGLAHFSVCLLFFILVQTFSWSPSEAKIPFALMAPAFTAVVAHPTLMILRKRW